MTKQALHWPQVLAAGPLLPLALATSLLSPHSFQGNSLLNVVLNKQKNQIKFLILGKSCIRLNLLHVSAEIIRENFPLNKTFPNQRFQLFLFYIFNSSYHLLLYNNLVLLPNNILYIISVLISSPNHTMLRLSSKKKLYPEILLYFTFIYILSSTVSSLWVYACVTPISLVCAHVYVVHVSHTVHVWGPEEKL